MRIAWKITIALSLFATWSWNTQAQDIPGSFGAAATPQATAAAATAAPAIAAAPKNIWSFFMKTDEQREKCRTRFCKSIPGKLLNGMLKPVSAATGGIIGPLCPDPLKAINKEDLKKPADSAQGAAAKIKAEEAEAKARMESVQYLGTVDCRYYPEAEAALINALRGDKNECVRTEAAKALARGCCCTSKIVKALTIVVNCSDEDGFPAERSEIVLAYAFIALDRCLKTCIQTDSQKSPEAPPEKGAEAVENEVSNAGGIQQAFYSKSSRNGKNAIYVDANKALNRGLNLSRDTLLKLNRPTNLKAILAEATPLPVVKISETVEPSTAPVETTPTPVVNPTEQPRTPRSVLSIYREAAAEKR